MPLIWKGYFGGPGSSLQLRQSLTELTAWVANLILKGDLGSMSQQGHYFSYPYTLLRIWMDIKFQKV